MPGDITVDGTVDGIDIAARDAILTSTTTTADAAVQPADTFFIGTTSIAHNRTSAALTLAGITLTTPDIGTPSSGDLSNCTFPTLNQSTSGTAANVTTNADLTGEVTSSGSNATTIAEGVVDEANLKISNAPTNGYVLSAQSNNDGGLTWVAASDGAGVTLTQVVQPNITTMEGFLGGTANALITDDGDGTVTSEDYFEIQDSRLNIGDNTAPGLTPRIDLINDENTATIGIAASTNDLITGSAGGDFVVNSFGDHDVIIGQNNSVALTISGGVAQFNRKFVPDKYKGDIVYFGSHATGVTEGDIVHYNSSDEWEKADANDVTKCSGLLGVVLGATLATDGVLLRGMSTLATNGIDGAEAVGSVLYLSSTTAGNASVDVPTGNGDVARIIGYCIETTNQKIWFNPDNTFVEVTA